jgi:hypothetical protein
MNSVMTAIEMTGIVEKDRRLHLDSDLPLLERTRVRVIVLYPSSEEQFETEMDEFRQHLASLGYNSKEEIIELVRQTKREQVREWENHN